MPKWTGNEARNAVSSETAEKMLGTLPLLPDLARDPSIGTPAYVYDVDAIAAEGRELLRAMRAPGDAPGDARQDGLVAYAVKANAAGPIVRALAREGCGADVVSGAELLLALACGMQPAQIVYSGVAKTDDELDLAIAHGICAIQAESLEELERVDARARAAGKIARVSIRVNPQVDAEDIGTHAHITTGHDEAKFGVPRGDVDLALARAAALGSAKLVGVACHVGSQLTSVEPYVQSARVLLGVAAQARAGGAPLEFVDTGGGFGIDYGAGCPVRPADFVRATRSAMREAGVSDLSLHVEPGRALVAAHGVLVARVIQAKETRVGTPRRWLMIDAGMNDLLRPALYQARHRVVAVSGGEGELVPWRVVGPVCESSCDFGEHLLPARPPSLVALLDAGAYGFTMASQYNGRALPVEVFLRGGRVVAKTARASRAAWADERASIREA
jgi:diaminopimelate decarboxylase